MQQAAKQAKAHEFISKLSEGYDTDIGEDGGQISLDSVHVWLAKSGEGAGGATT